MADHGHFGGRPGETRQGIYICAPSGRFLASTNSLNPNSVIRLMNRGWERWDELSADERRLPADSQIRPQHRWEDSYPDDGLVLSMFVRDLPMTCDPGQTKREKWNRDFVWFSKDEARQWLPADIDASIGHEHQLPQPLLSRLIRFHLVDVARGQTSPMTLDEIADAEITIQVRSRDEDHIDLAFHGQTRSTAKMDKYPLNWDDILSLRRRGRDTDHGVLTQIKGYARYDLMAERFVEFEFVALGTRYGRTRFNGRYWDREDSSPLGYVFQLATPSTPKVAPGFIAYYDAPWLQRPNQAAKREFRVKGEAP